jgi:DNA-binding transcriptional regulator YdaS (Cro superfamily)
MDRDTNHFVETLRRCVHLLGGQHAAEKATGIDQSTLSRWMRGKVGKFPPDTPRRFETATKGIVKAREFYPR